MLKKESGLSLAEILVAMGIILILALLIYPNLKTYLTQQLLSANAEKFVGYLKLAQQRTVTEQLKYAIKVNLLSQNYYLVKKGSPDIVLENYSLAEPISFNQINGLVDNEVVFNPTGAVDFSGDIYLLHQQTNEQKKIMIKPSGYVVSEKVE